MKYPACTTSAASVTGVDLLDLARGGYWIAASVDECSPRKTKHYFDAKLHGGIEGAALLRSFMAVNGIRSESCRQLLKVAEEIEAAGSGEMVGSVLQIRPAACGKEIEAKLYFRISHERGFGLRRAAARMARLAAVHSGPDAAQAVREGILSRDKLVGTFYIGVAFRPELEIETYHDCEPSGSVSLAPLVIQDLVQLGRGSDSANGLVSDILASAVCEDFACSHVALDLLGGAGSASLFLDAPEGDEHEAVQRLIDRLSGLDGWRHGHLQPEDYRIEKTFTPMMLGVKVDVGDRPGFELVIEEVSEIGRAIF